MAIAGFNPAGEMSQLRTQQTLAMQSSGAAPAPAASAAAASGAPSPADAAAAGAAAPGAAADASMGAAALQQPPNTTKIVLQAVMKGALSGASVTMGLKSFAPFLGKIGFISRAMGTFGTAAASGAAKVAGTGLLGFLGKIPILGAILPRAFAGGIGGFVITALIGAAVGGIAGVFSGLKAAKAQTAAYNEAVANAPAPVPAATPGDPVTTPDTAPPASAGAKPPAKAAPHGKWKSWVIAKHGTHLGTQKTGHYNAKSGDTIAMLAKRFYTTPAEIRKLNPGLKGDTVPAGTKVILARKVVPDAKAWVA